MKLCFSTVPVFRKSKIFVQQINLFISWKSKGNDYILSEILDIQLISFYRYWLGFLDILSHLLKYQALIWFTWRIENILSLCHGHWAISILKVLHLWHNVTDLRRGLDQGWVDKAEGLHDPVHLGPADRIWFCSYLSTHKIMKGCTIQLLTLMAFLVR